MEKLRRTHYRDKVSRSWGIYTFIDKEAADRARRELALPHMTADTLAEISLAETTRTSIHDLNWITYRDGDPDPSWMHAYWKGEPCPGHTPVWEKLVEGHINVLGTTLREKAYQILRSQFPGSLCFLEIARIAAWVGADLGSIAAFLVPKGDDFCLSYYLNMEDANNPEVLKQISDYVQSGKPVNRNDLEPFFKNNTFGLVPDLRELSFIKPKSEMPYLGDLL